jgi:hypothetical protein
MVLAAAMNDSFKLQVSSFKSEPGPMPQSAGARQLRRFSVLHLGKTAFVKGVWY